MPLNWGLELIKWKRLTCRFQRINHLEAIQSILCGIFLGLLTPNRVGELGGRLLHIEKKNRIKSLYVNGICSLSQTLSTILFGSIATIYFADLISREINSSKYLLITLSLIVPLLFLLIYLQSNALKHLFKTVGSKFGEYHNLETIEFSVKERIRTLLLSIFRFIVFGIQFSMLLVVFIPELSVLTSFIAVSLIYLCSTIVPTTWLSSLPVRTSFSFLIVDIMGYDGYAALISSILLWIINLLFPALFGLFVVNREGWKKMMQKSKAV